MQEKKLTKRLSNELPARIKQVSYPQLFLQWSLTKYLRVSGGLLLAATLLVPIFWIPGLVILVLPAEVYLLDWVHSQYTKSLVKESLFDKSSGYDIDLEEAERKRSTLHKDRQSPFTR